MGAQSVSRQDPESSNKIDRFFSLITVSPNARRTIHRCIDSVSDQTFRDYEHIVFDGASTDGTAEYLETRHDCFSIFLSEPDSGIYAAWNKALRHASGKWILFLSADDALADRHVLDNMHDELLRVDLDTRLVYGDIMYVSLSDWPDLMYDTKPVELICRKYSGVRL